MKATLSYKSKRNIVIASIIVILLIGISTAGYFYIKGNDETARAFTQSNVTPGEQTQAEAEPKDDSDKSTSTENNSVNQEQTEQNANNANNNDSETPTQGNSQRQTTTAGNQTQPANNNNNTPMQEYVTERVVEKDVLVSEDYLVEWQPLNIKAETTTAGLSIIRPILAINKEVDKTVQQEMNKEKQRDGELTYTITITNSGNAVGIALLKDCAPQGTTFVPGSIKINGTEKVKIGDREIELTEENMENLTEAQLRDEGFLFEVPEAVEKKVNDETEIVDSKITVSFKVTINEVEKEKNVEVIENTATINEKETNKVVTDIPKIKVEKDVFMINGEIIPEEKLDTVSVQDGDTVGYKIKVTNIGTVKLNNVTLVDILENQKQIYLDINKPDEKTNTIVKYEDELSLEPRKSKEYIVYYDVEKEDVANINTKDSLRNEVEAKGYYTNDDGEEDYVNDIDDEIIKFSIIPNISIIKTQKVGKKNLTADGLDSNGNQVKLKPDDVIDYTIRIKNEGNTKLTNVIITDVMNSNPSNETRNVKIKDVKVEGEKRNYTVNEDGSLTIEGTLNVNEELVITASYTVKETDMSANKIETIKNTATVETKETEPKSSTVETKTIEYKPEIKISKRGELKDGSDANNVTLKYGDEVTYILSAKNTGTKYGTAVIKDTDIKTWLDNGDIEIIGNITVEHYNADGSKKKETIKNNKAKKLVDGIEVYLPANKNKIATVKFTVKITAKPGTKIVNTVVGGDGKVVNPVNKQASITSTSYKGKNIVIVLDLSSSMLKQGLANDDYPLPITYSEEDQRKGLGKAGRINTNNIKLLNEFGANANEYAKKTKLYKEKVAVNEFIDAVLKNPDNKVTIITFNFANIKDAEKCLNNNVDYWDRIKNEKFAKPYIGTQVLVNSSNNAQKLKTAVSNIKITMPLLTNVVAAMNQTEATVKELAKDKTRDIDVVFIGDGRASLTSDNNATAGFYDKTETMNRIGNAANKIKNTYGANIYTVAYAVPQKEQAIANETFNSMSSGAEYRLVASNSNLNEKLADLERSLSNPVTVIETTDQEGKVIFAIQANSVIREGSDTPITLTIGSKSYKFNSINELNKAGNGINTTDKEIIKFEDNKFTIYANKIDAEAKISLSYYYKPTK